MMMRLITESVTNGFISKNTGNFIAMHSEISCYQKQMKLRRDLDGSLIPKTVRINYDI